MDAMSLLGHTKYCLLMQTLVGGADFLWRLRARAVLNHQRIEENTELMEDKHHSSRR